jgi:hypothetical protein
VLKNIDSHLYFNYFVTFLLYNLYLYSFVVLVIYLVSILYVCTAFTITKKEEGPFFSKADALEAMPDPPLCLSWDKLQRLGKDFGLEFLP